MFVEEIIVRLILLVVELSKFLYPKFSLAADCPPLEFPAIHPIYAWQQGYVIISFLDNPSYKDLYSISHITFYY